MFQVNDLLIGRLENGDVRLVKLDPTFGRHRDPHINTIFATHEVQLDVTIPWGLWLAMVDSVAHPHKHR